MRLLIMGPPGAGKGTQATGLAAHYGIPAISTGAIFRAAVADESPLGVTIKTILDNGGYVDDTLTEKVVAERLAEPDCEPGWLLDGFPRTVHQVGALDEINEAAGAELDAVVCLVADTDELVGRMLKRAVAEGRSDDNEATIRRRQEIYRAETKPLLDTYRARDLLVEIDALGTVEEVARRLQDSLDAFLARKNG